jgi:hypothetical protein
MKSLFTVLFSTAVLAAPATHAQIVFNSSTFNNVIVTTDTLGRLSGSYPNVTTGANQNIDMTGIAYDNTRYYSEQFVGPNPFAQGTGYDEARGYEHGRLKFDTRRWSAVTANGLERFGEVMPRQAISLSAVPGAGANDSLIIPAQNAAYTTPYQLIKFPSTYQDQWSSDFSYTVNMEMQAPGLGYVGTPVQLKVRTQYAFEIIGWGHVDLLLLDNTFGQSDILFERIAGSTIDSIFFNGAVANSTEAAMFGFTQNRTSKTYFDEFLRVNEVTPLVLFNYGADQTYSNPTDVRVHQLRVPFATSVSNITYAAPGDAVSVYPNPAKKGVTLNVYLPPAITHQVSGNYQYTVCDLIGRTLAQGTTAGDVRSLSGFTLPVAIPEHVAPGTYWISVFDGGRKLTSTPFVLGQ